MFAFIFSIKTYVVGLYIELENMTLDLFKTSEMFSKVRKTILEFVSLLVMCASKIKVLLAAIIFVFFATTVFGAPIAVPDMADVITSITNVFGAVLTVAVSIFGFKKIKSLL